MRAECNDQMRMSDNLNMKSIVASSEWLSMYFLFLRYRWYKSHSPKIGACYHISNFIIYVECDYFTRATLVLQEMSAVSIMKESRVSIYRANFLSLCLVTQRPRF